MNGSKYLILVIATLLSLILVAVLFFFQIQNGPGANRSGWESSKKLAGELVDNNLPLAAVAEYQKLLDSPGLPDVERANVAYLAGKIYYESLGDYENAAAYMIRARALNPQGSFFEESGRILIASLEKMGRMLDARRELDKSVNIDSVYAAHPGEIMVARINERPVFLSEIEDDLQNLPPQMQAEFQTRENRLKAVQNYIGVELIHRAAVREGLDRNPEILKISDRVLKQVIVEKFIEEKVLSQVKMDTADIRNYYTAYKKEKFADKPFDQVREEVVKAYRQEKMQQAFAEYVGKLSAVEKVQIFEDKIK